MYDPSSGMLLWHFDSIACFFLFQTLSRSFIRDVRDVRGDTTTTKLLYKDLPEPVAEYTFPFERSILLWSHKEARSNWLAVLEITTSKRSVAASRYDAIIIFLSCFLQSASSLVIRSKFLSPPRHNDAITENKRTTWYFILFYFSAYQSLIGSQQANQRHDVTTDFLVVKY